MKPVRTTTTGAERGSTPECAPPPRNAARHARHSPGNRGWRSTGAEASYDRESLHGYLAGSGEFYLTYDFRSLRVQQCRDATGSEAVVERYDMGSSADACGVFLHEWRGGEAGVGQGAECAAGLLRCWKGPHFVRVSAADDRDALDLGRQVVKSITATGPPPQLLTRLPGAGMVPGSQRYFHTWSVLNHQYFLAQENLLHLSSDTDCAWADYADSTFRGKLLIVRYARLADCQDGWLRFQSRLFPERLPSDQSFCHPMEGDEWFAGRLAEREVVLALGATSSRLAAQLVESVKWTIPLPALR